MFDDKNILFAGLELPPIDKERVLSEIAKVPESAWVWDSYRSTSILPIMTKNGLYDKNSLITVGKPSSHSLDFLWTELSPPSIQAYFEEHIFSWIKPRPRVAILKTAAFAENREHIDCTLAQMGSRQLKFRLVVSGKVSSLYFITDTEKMHVPDIETPFLMDGSWPHGMKNDSPVEKITICVGFPWTGADSYPRWHSTINKNNYRMPENLETYFKRPS